MQKFNAARPWSLVAIQRLLMKGFKEGAKLAASDAAVRESASGASDLEDAFTGVARRVAEQTAWRLSDSIATESPARWPAGIESVITAASQAAVVLGARAIASAEVESSSVLQSLAEDELWLCPHVDRLLLQVVDSLVATGYPLPGAQQFIERARGTPRPDLLDFSSGTSREVRTSWIRDADTAQVYQWCARDTGVAVVVEKRLCGSRSPHCATSMLPGDVEVVVRMLQRLLDTPPLC